MKIYLIRHAESEENSNSVLYSGSTDPILTTKGQKQAKDLADFFSDAIPTVIFASDKKRTYLTAKPLADQFSIKIQKSSLLNEINFGIFEGLTTQEVKIKFPNEYNLREKDKINYKIPNGESYTDVFCRQKKFFSRFYTKTKSEESIFIFSHAGFIKIFISCFLGNVEFIKNNIFINNCSVTQIALNNGKIEPILINQNVI